MSNPDDAALRVIASTGAVREVHVRRGHAIHKPAMRRGQLIE